MSFEGEQQKIEHDGSRKNFSAYISMVWPEEKMMYNFCDEMNSINGYRNLVDDIDVLGKYHEDSHYIIGKDLSNKNRLKEDILR